MKSERDGHIRDGTGQFNEINSAGRLSESLAVCPSHSKQRQK